MKRSRSVKRVLLGTFSAGVLAAATPRIVIDRYYTNDVHVPGAGYYHAPFQKFYEHPYNTYDASRQQYYYGGEWHAAAHKSIVNISSPSAEEANRAERARTDRPAHIPFIPLPIPTAAAAAAAQQPYNRQAVVPPNSNDDTPRSGFGGTSNRRSTPS